MASQTAPNYAFIWDEAGFEGTTARIRERQQAGDARGMAAEITDDHLSAFVTESTWEGLAAALIGKYQGLAGRLVIYNAVTDRVNLERYGEVARRISEQASDGCQTGQVSGRP